MKSALTLFYCLMTSCLMTTSAASAPEIIHDPQRYLHREVTRFPITGSFEECRKYLQTKLTEISNSQYPFGPLAGITPNLFEYNNNIGVSRIGNLGSENTSAFRLTPQDPYRYDFWIKVICRDDAKSSATTIEVVIEYWESVDGSPVGAYGLKTAQLLSRDMASEFGPGCRVRRYYCSVYAYCGFENVFDDSSKEELMEILDGCDQEPWKRE